MEKVETGSAERPIAANSSFSSLILCALTQFVYLIYQHTWYTFQKIVPQNPLLLHRRIHLPVQATCFFQGNNVEYAMEMKASQYEDIHLKEREIGLFTRQRVLHPVQPLCLFKCNNAGQTQRTCTSLVCRNKRMQPRKLTMQEGTQLA